MRRDESLTVMSFLFISFCFAMHTCTRLHVTWNVIYEKFYFILYVHGSTFIWMTHVHVSKSEWVCVCMCFVQQCLLNTMEKHIHRWCKGCHAYWQTHAYCAYTLTHTHSQQTCHFITYVICKIGSLCALFIHGCNHFLDTTYVWISGPSLFAF